MLCLLAAVELVCLLLSLSPMTHFGAISSFESVLVAVVVADSAVAVCLLILLEYSLAMLRTLDCLLSLTAGRVVVSSALSLEEVPPVVLLFSFIDLLRRLVSLESKLNKLFDFSSLI